MKSYIHKMAKRCILVVFLVYICFRPHSAEETSPERHPNIVVILVDNLGIEDLSCYGARSWRTPNIDQLSEAGVKFTRWYSEASGVASRSSILTGLLPTRTGMIRSSFLPFEGFPSLASTGGLQEKQITLAEILKRRNFTTAFIGHWGLGLGRKGCFLPNKQGFDYWYGVPNMHTDWCREGDSNISDQEHGLWSFLSSFLVLWATSLLGAAAVFWYIGNVNWKLFLGFAAVSGLTVYFTYISFFAIDFIGKRGCVLYRNEDIIEQPYAIENMTLRFTREAVKFVRSSPGGVVRKPFFLFVSYMKMHYPLHVSKIFWSANATNNQFVGALTELDWSVGKITKAIHGLGIDEDTIIILTSTHGHTLETTGTFPVQGFKPDVWEAVLRVPALIRWTGKIQAGQTINTTTTLRDLMPTLLELTNQTTDEIPSDGHSLLPVLINSSAEHRQECLFHYADIGKPAAVSCGSFRAVFFTYKDDGSKEVHKPPLLYDMEAEPGETTALQVQEHGDLLKNISDAVSKHLEQRKNKWLSQLDSPIVPFLFPCANFPSCFKASTESMDFSDLFQENV